MTRPEILLLVNRWIGVTGGYLGDFSYRSHQEFYPLECGLDIDPLPLPGTTRARFIAILEAAPPENQAKILRGTLARFPLYAEPAPSSRTPELLAQIEAIIARLEGVGPVAMPQLGVTSEVVARAISDSEALLQSGGPTSALDRVHTTLHGYLLGILRAAGVDHDPEAPTTRLFSILRQTHPAFVDTSGHADRTTTVLRALASIIDAFGPLRNRGSVVHPNDELLPAAEAMLAINAARTLLHYVESKLAVPRT